MEDFAFTIKFNTCKDCHPSVNDYEDVFRYWLMQDPNIDLQDYNYEYDSQDRLHVHGIISLPTKFYRKRLMYNNLHMKLKLITDREGWLSYIHKDILTDETSDDSFEMPTKKLF